MLLPAFGRRTLAHEADVKPVLRTEEEWWDLLSPEQYAILRAGETEDPGSSALNAEYRQGIYRCAACDLDLFRSEWKYNSRTGWPSFFDAIPGHLQEHRIILSYFTPIEYKCARCGGHHGHLFDDGPEPTGKRYCNNGKVLTFIPDEA